MNTKKADTKGQREEKNVLDELLGIPEDDDGLDISEPAMIERRLPAKKRHLQLESETVQSVKVEPSNGSTIVRQVDIISLSSSPLQSKRMRSDSVCSILSECSLSTSVQSISADPNADPDDDDDGSCSCDGHSSIASDSASDTRSYSLHSSSSASSPMPSKSNRPVEPFHKPDHNHSTANRHRKRSHGSSRKRRKVEESRKLSRTTTHGKSTRTSLESKNATAQHQHDNNNHERSSRLTKNRSDDVKKDYGEKRPDAKRTHHHNRSTVASSDNVAHSVHSNTSNHLNNGASNVPPSRQTVERYADLGRRYAAPELITSTALTGPSMRDDMFAEPTIRPLPADYESLLRHFFKDAAFFVMKSSNFENIDLSKRLGVWSTRPANEQKLNRAFNQYRNVLLLFSVQESGHFQGFARLIDNSVHDRPSVPWLLPPGLTVNALGGTFELDWLNTNHLPFNRTLHLFNPMNEGKPVKVARDGQQVEPRVGQELCRLFDEDYDCDLIPKLRRMRQQTTNRPTIGRSSVIDSGGWTVNNSRRIMHSNAQVHYSPAGSRYRSLSSGQSNSRLSNQRIFMGGVAEFRRAFSSLNSASSSQDPPIHVSRNIHVLDRIYDDSDRRTRSSNRSHHDHYSQTGARPISYRSMDRRPH